MPTYTYTLDIPNGDLSPAQNRPTMTTNNNSINSIIGVDHYTFGSTNSNDGYHQQITFANVTSPSTPSNPYSILYTKNDSATNPQLFFLNSQNPTYYTSGSTVLMGGIILQWGVNSGNSPVSFPVVFPNNCFSVVITANSNSAQFNVTGKTTSQFTYGSNPAGQKNFFWMAIGN